LFVLPLAVREEKVLVRYTCALACRWPDRKKGGKRRFPNAGRVGGSSSGENGAGFLRVFRLCRTVCEGNELLEKLLRWPFRVDDDDDDDGGGGGGGGSLRRYNIRRD
jgi:hypothetical protein